MTEKRTRRKKQKNDCMNTLRCTFRFMAFLTFEENVYIYRGFDHFYNTLVHIILFLVMKSSYFYRLILR